MKSFVAFWFAIWNFQLVVISDFVVSNGVTGPNCPNKFECWYFEPDMNSSKYLESVHIPSRKPSANFGIPHRASPTMYGLDGANRRRGREANVTLTIRGGAWMEPAHIWEVILWVLKYSPRNRSRAVKRQKCPDDGFFYVSVVRVRNSCSDRNLTRTRTKYICINCE